MKLSISHLAWTPSQDAELYPRMRELGYSGLEIAPTRLFPDRPYQHLQEAAAWRRQLGTLAVVSMQSIWYGRTEQLFGTDEERAALLAYTKQAIDFAAVLECPNLVFGCPKNRVRPPDAKPETALDFFQTVGDYAAAHGTVLALEANPPIYGTNYINTTAEALALVQQVNSKGFRVNLDVGTMLENHETADDLSDAAGWVHHVHISTPYLRPIVPHPLHQALAEQLRQMGYDGYCSVEMAGGQSVDAICNILTIVRGVMG